MREKYATSRNEDWANVNGICDRCAERRRVEFQRTVDWQTVNRRIKEGRIVLVKLPFGAEDEREHPTGHGLGEHMWVWLRKQVNIAANLGIGLLANFPTDRGNGRIWDVVLFPLSQAEEMMEQEQ